MYGALRAQRQYPSLSSRVLAAIDAPGRACLADLDSRETWQRVGEPRPDPDSELFARGILESRDVVDSGPGVVPAGAFLPQRNPRSLCV